MKNNKSPLLLTIYGDSLSMPRSFGGVRCDQVYSELLREDRSFAEEFNVVVFNRAQGGIRIQELFDRFYKDLTYIAEDTNKILVIQCGIVDCAPRPVTFSLRNFIGKLPVRVRIKIIQFLHHYRASIQRVFRFRFTSPAKFHKVLKDWLALAGPTFKNIYIVNIFPTIQSVAEHSPGLSESIQMYNEIIAQGIQKCGLKHVVLIDVFGEVALSKEPVERFISEKDGHHLTAEGHELIKQLILRKHEK